MKSNRPERPKSKRIAFPIFLSQGSLLKRYLIGFSAFVVIGLVLSGVGEGREPPITIVAKVSPTTAADTSSDDGANSAMLETIVSPSHSGEVTFLHRQHFEELEIECEACHHETNAATLEFPHDAYFEDFWIDCKICHSESATAPASPQACSKCHHDSPVNLADETLSAKVVIHKNCWECHGTEKGVDASVNCAFCHSGPKMKFK
jgi:hypothetical protein